MTPRLGQFRSSPSHVPRHANSPPPLRSRAAPAGSARHFRHCRCAGHSGAAGGPCHRDPDKGRNLQRDSRCQGELPRATPRAIAWGFGHQVGVDHRIDVPGHEHDGQVWMPQPHLGGELRARRLGHDDIGQQDVDRTRGRLDQVQRGRAPAGARDHVARAFEYPLRRAPDRVVVLHEEHVPPLAAGCGLLIGVTLGQIIMVGGWKVDDDDRSLPDLRPDVTVAIRRGAAGCAREHDPRRRRYDFAPRRDGADARARRLSRPHRRQRKRSARSGRRLPRTHRCSADRRDHAGDARAGSRR